MSKENTCPHCGGFLQSNELFVENKWEKELRCVNCGRTYPIPAPISTSCQDYYNTLVLCNGCQTTFVCHTTTGTLSDSQLETPCNECGSSGEDNFSVISYNPEKNKPKKKGDFMTLREYLEKHNLSLTELPVKVQEKISDYVLSWSLSTDSLSDLAEVSGAMSEDVTRFFETANRKEKNI